MTCRAGLDFEPKSLPCPFHLKWHRALGKGAQIGQPWFTVWSFPLESLKDLKGVTTRSLSDQPSRYPTSDLKIASREAASMFGFRSCFGISSSLRPHLWRRCIYTYRPRSHPPSSLGRLLHAHVCSPLPGLGSHSTPHQPCPWFSSSRAFWSEKLSSWKLSEIKPLACFVLDHLN